MPRKDHNQSIHGTGICTGNKSRNKTGTEYQKTTPYRPNKDHHKQFTERFWQLKILQFAENLQLPVFGICKGMQLMMVNKGNILQSHIKEHNQKILQLIADKQEESLKGKTVKELEKLLK